VGVKGKIALTTSAMTLFKGSMRVQLGQR